MILIAGQLFILKSFNFAKHLLAWFDLHGRKDLPWQLDATPYHVWLSEIMLQQTQVSTVIPYYLKFTNRFPSINELAAAQLDDVLAHWSGLGYYARARNLHKSAQQIMRQYAGEIPSDFDALLLLPGIGRSTAGAIMALAHHQNYPILDGNVKRVLCRFDAVPNWSGDKETEKQLWQRAQTLLPETRIANYIQAQMDLGATLCTRSRPNCSLCPLKIACKAYQANAVSDFPKPKPKKVKNPVRASKWLVMLNQNDEVFLLKRPSSGIWGGLWSFPEFENVAEIESFCDEHFHFTAQQVFAKETFSHVFTHFKLEISPYLITGVSQTTSDIQVGNWYKISDIIDLGLPAPVKAFLNSLD